MYRLAIKLNLAVILFVLNQTNVGLFESVHEDIERKFQILPNETLKYTSKLKLKAPLFIVRLKHCSSVFFCYHKKRFKRYVPIYVLSRVKQF